MQHSTRYLWLLFIVVAACRETAVATPSPTPTHNLSLPDGYLATPWVTGLSRPTQFLMGPDGRLWVAQLFAGEGDELGQVIAVNPDDGTQTVLLNNLNKPTGIAILQDALWIAEESRLLRAPLDAQMQPGNLEVVLQDMPNNGRSNGTLTVSPDDQLIYETSGQRQGNRAAAGSGMLWTLDPGQPEVPSILATGLKNAYAHTFDANGRLWVTEIGDGSVRGTDYEGQPPEEINLIVAGQDYGWPQCFGNREPAFNRDGSPEKCANSQQPTALIDPQSTPTSIVMSPWDDQVLLVALWLKNEVLAITLSTQDGQLVGESAPFITGFDNPQHLLSLPDGTLLVSDYRLGTIYRIEKSQN